MVERAAPGDGIERGRGPTRRRILWQELVGILRRVATAARLRRAVKPPRYTRAEMIAISRELRREVR